MKKRAILLGVLILAAGGAFWAFRSRGAEKPLVLSGSIEARDVEVGSLLGGRVAKVPVAEGARVSRGQSLVVFETDLIDLQLRQQEARVAEGRANLARIERGPRSEDVARSRAEADNAERERRRHRALLDQGVIGQQQYDMVATGARTSLETLREKERGSRPEDVAAARAALQREEAQLAYLQRQKQESVVVAPADGILESIDLRPGDLVAPNQPVAKLIEPSQIWVRVYVPEPSLGRVRVGEKASVRVDTFPNRSFAGRVVEIRTAAEYTPRNVQTLEQRMDTVFGVKIAIDPAPELKPGMAASVVISETP
ncbi:MAG: efflux RND transporter periplasmic adaptor subunit [Acidobacteria bacterium]|nr:efflux RND transporter periplasmic adaptor subunit [Acidobacteriota bacterium]MCA1611593.1 efflux RND transporter periplasmic adaptor subunit [Acidobacteriota bacterium]